MMQLRLLQRRPRRQQRKKKEPARGIKTSRKWRRKKKRRRMKEDRWTLMTVRFVQVLKLHLFFHQHVSNYRRKSSEWFQNSNFKIFESKESFVLSQ